jgi:hypothetical protein
MKPERHPYCTAVKTRERYHGKLVWLCRCLICGNPQVKSTRPAAVVIYHSGPPDGPGGHFVEAPAD